MKKTITLQVQMTAMRQKLTSEQGVENAKSISQNI